MNIRLNQSVAILGLFGFAVASLNAETRSFSDAELASGNPVVKDGILIWTWPENGGSFSFITEGIHTGLWLGQSNTTGTYTLTFSEPVISVEIEFDALSAGSGYSAESITDFSTSNGPAAIDFIPQGGAVFDSGAIIATAPDGQGIIQHREARPFTSFTFRHDQPSAANGFVIERIQIELLNRTPIGSAHSVWGSPIITRDGSSSALLAGDPIYSGDVLETVAGEGVELEFIDETKIAISENARFEIDDYHYGEPASGESRSRFGFLRGLFHYVSGLIAANDHDDVEFRTPFAALGPRGTEFSIEVVEDGPMTEVTLAVVSGAVAFENWWTGEVSEIAAGGSLQAEAPIPSQQTVSPAHRVVPADGGDYDFQVTSSGHLWSWSVSEGVEWVGSDSPTDWPGNGTFHYQVAPNPDPAPRRATITLASGSFTATHTIHQAGAIPGDTTPPGLEILSPGEGVVLGPTQPILIEAELSDNLGLMDFVEISLNGSEPFLVEPHSPDLTEKRLEWGYQLWPGEHTFVITAYDRAGNSVSVTRSFTFSFAGPHQPAPLPALVRVSKPKRFPVTRVGKRSRPQTLRIFNAGGSPLTGLHVVASGRARRDFLLVRPARKTLAPGASTVFKATFRPRSAGVRRAVVGVRSNASPAKVSLSGRGKAGRGMARR